MSNTRRLWTILGLILLASFGVLGYMGRQIYLSAPPVPDLVRTESGATVYTRDDIERGRQVWQSIGGHQLGSIWGHGSYVAPDWSADWLHRESIALLEHWAQSGFGSSYEELRKGEQASLQARLRDELRPNRYDAASGTVVVSDERAAAIRAVAQHYDSLFGVDPALATLREQYAIAENPIPDPARRAALSAFVFWSSWSAVTNRPDEDVSYTNNWPAEPLVGNSPTTPTFLWTIVSILFLLAGVGALAWWHAAQRRETPLEVPQTDPLRALEVTPSMRATAKYFWLVVALFAV